MLILGAVLTGAGSCSNEKRTSNNNDGLAMDSASVAERAKDKLTLSRLKSKKLAAEQNASESHGYCRRARKLPPAIQRIAFHQFAGTKLGIQRMGMA